MFKIKHFNDLTVEEFYEIAKARYEVFACEQHIFEENDFDDTDKVSYHVFSYDNDKIVAYLRIIPKEFSYYENTGIGRVLVLKEYRRSGLAKKMVYFAIDFITEILKEDSISLSAQEYISSLYEKCGFIAVSDVYLEVGIPHVEMEYNKFRDIKVLMEKNNPSEYPKFDLPEGFSLVKYKDGYEKDWAKIQTDLEQFESIDEALKCFKDTFLDVTDDVYKKCFFIQNKDGKNIATASIWNGNHFGKTLQRIHWVAVSKEYQGLGLAKSLVSAALDVFNELGFKDYIYLTSQVSSYKALNIYSKFGFIPYTDKMPINWDMDEKEFEKETKYAWKQINLLSKKK
ncbi:GNAT family N-acetyltransferase [Peptacetobacter hiranonis]|uniref:Acetyltransferase, GNAT family n=1 Tax=Peptacetobacter hiranonis (strain DSM 13275 / JCM 10541 / KCTC 15199 / TO-931) TaxID=500633 RepID=B6FZG1_PEPHT|nr:GNAT family N-acetyltransferase [Peptacetobacter hiranonis]EEA85063.1 acetyltransferase, GNAT family [Peptacetobacter hiranonis DSM 13275]QEK20953.1 Acetyltransferase [Peptacetobacter hiranonis]